MIDATAPIQKLPIPIVIRQTRAFMKIADKKLKLKSWNIIRDPKTNELSCVSINPYTGACGLNIVSRGTNSKTCTMLLYVNQSHHKFRYRIQSYGCIPTKKV